MNVFEQMLASYEADDREDKLNAIHDVMQQVTLAALGLCLPRWGRRFTSALSRSA